MNRRTFISSVFGSLMAVEMEGISYASSLLPGATEKKEWKFLPGSKVPTKRLGKTDIDTPILIMGCCQELDPVYDKKLHRCYELGVNHLDTAQMYAEGNSHKTIAPFIKQIGDRKKLIIASKVHLSEDEATPEKFIKNLESSLEDLETDYLDIFYMHIVKHPRLLEKEFIEMGDKLKKTGKIRYFGFSVHHGVAPELMLKACELGGGIDVIMFKYSFREFGYDKLNRAIDACKRAGIGLIAMKTLGSIPDEAEEIVPWTSKNFTKIQAKLKAVWGDERIDGIASQMTNIQQVHENAWAAISKEKLSKDEMEKLIQIAKVTDHLYCRGCSYICEGKLKKKLYVEDVWRCLLYAKNYKDISWANYCYKGIKDYVRKLSPRDIELAGKLCPHNLDLVKIYNEVEKIIGS
ncbi:MAG: aldo/keto reductase [Candidatus Hydrogenedentes bacterium]|nr:aldo/keto reductase [Candidatus Hydrogenedentota bacterium]